MNVDELVRLGLLNLAAELNGRLPDEQLGAVLRQAEPVLRAVAAMCIAAARHPMPIATGPKLRAVEEDDGA